MHAFASSKNSYWPATGSDLRALGVGSFALAVLAVIDLLLGGEVGIEGTFVIAPLVAAMIGSMRSVLIVTVLAVVAALVIGLSQAPGEQTAVKATLVGVAGAASLVLSRRQSSARRTAAEQSLLEAISHTADRDSSLQDSTETIIGLLQDGFATGCSISILDNAGNERVLAKAGPTGAENAPRWGYPHGATQTVRIPMSARGTEIGFLTLSRSIGGGFRSGEMPLIEQLANRIGRALDNAGIFDEFESLSRRLDTVLALVDESVFITSPEGRALFANQSGRKLFRIPADTAPTDAGEIWAEAARKIMIETEEGHRVGNLGRTIARLLKSGQEWSGILRMHYTEDRTERWIAAKARPIRSRKAGDLLYMVYTADDITWLKGREAIQRILAEISSTLTEDVGITGSFQAVADACVPDFADSCWVLVPGEGDTLEPVALAHRDPALKRSMEEYNEAYPISLDQQLKVVESYLTGEAESFALGEETIANAADDPTQADLIRRIGNVSGLVVPLRLGPEILGVLAFGNGVDSRVFQRFDREAGETIAKRCAEVISRERQSQENREITKILEFDLRPASLPQVPGIELAEMFESSTQLSQIGGDFYEAFESHGHSNLVIGDVVGRGATAAALTLESRDTLRVALEMTGDPAEALIRLDQRLRSRDRGEQVTVAIVRIPVDDPGTLLVTSAGHPLPILARDGRAKELGRSGPILGLGIADGWPEEEIEWSDDSVLILYTDGISETRSGSELFGYERIAIAANRSISLSQIATTLASDLRDFTDGQLEGSDDRAAIFAARNGRALEPDQNLALS